MKYISNLLFSIVLFATFSSCSTQKNLTGSKNILKAESILHQSIEAHGGSNYENSYYEFTFRKKKYTFQNQGVRFTYTSESDKDNINTYDRLDNIGFTRKIDGNLTRLSEAQSKSYSGSLNSVIYFATLPYKLKDPAVIKSYKGETTIKGKKYHILEIRFTEENGGQDHDDTFHYWIGKDDFVIDYLAYNYTVNGGGVRFRAAYNKRSVGGIIFQDFINYKAPLGTKLIDLPKLLEDNKLNQLSLIETENIINLK